MFVWTVIFLSCHWWILATDSYQSIFSSRQVISEIVESCRSHEITDLILVHEHRGQPDGLIVCHLPLGPTACFGLLNVVSANICFIHDELGQCTTWDTILGGNSWFHLWQVTRHDIKDRKAMGKMSETYPHLILDNFTTKVLHNWILSHFVLIYLTC